MSDNFSHKPSKSNCQEYIYIKMTNILNPISETAYEQKWAC